MNLDTSSIPKGVHGACPRKCRDHRGKILTNLHMLSTIKQQVRVTSSDWTSRSRESSGNSDQDRRDQIFHKSGTWCQQSNNEYA